MNGKIIHIAEDSTQTDITECVQTIYDLVIGSMDFGSGFLSLEDALPLAQIAHLCGFKSTEEVDRYVHKEQHTSEKQAYAKAFFQEHGFQPTVLQRRGLGWAEMHHEHAWSSVGRCMWYGCDVERKEGS